MLCDQDDQVSWCMDKDGLVDWAHSQPDDAYFCPSCNARLVAQNRKGNRSPKEFYCPNTMCLDERTWIKESDILDIDRVGV